MKWTHCSTLQPQKDFRNTQSTTGKKLGNLWQSKISKSLFQDWLNTDIRPLPCNSNSAGHMPTSKGPRSPWPEFAALPYRLYRIHQLLSSLMFRGSQELRKSILRGVGGREREMSLCRMDSTQARPQVHHAERSQINLTPTASLDASAGWMLCSGFWGTVSRNKPVATMSTHQPKRKCLLQNKQ